MNMDGGVGGGTGCGTENCEVLILLPPANKLEAAKAWRSDGVNPRFMGRLTDALPLLFGGWELLLDNKAFMKAGMFAGRKEWVWL